MLGKNVRWAEQHCCNNPNIDFNCGCSWQHLFYKEGKGMGDCNRPDGSCAPKSYEAPTQPYQQPTENWCQTAAGDAWKGKGTTISYDGQTKPQYDKMVEQFPYNADKKPGEKGNVQAAYEESAKTGKPIVFVIGKFDGSNPRNVTDLLKGAPDAIKVYVDPDKCADPKLKAFAESELKGGHNASVAVVYSMEHDKDGNRELARQYRLQGGDKSMQPELLDKIAKAERKPEGPSAAELKQIAEAKEKAAAEKASADKAAADKATADKAAADKAAELKTAEEKGRAAGKAEARKEIATIVAPGLVAGVELGKVIIEHPVEAAKVAAVVVAPGLVAGVELGKVIIENPVQAAKVAAVVAVPGLLPAVAGAKLGARVVKGLWDMVPEFP
ncbi:hypothetical protein BH10CYA1_BH10CYA1_20460 [soil metagenome]